MAKTKDDLRGQQINAFFHALQETGVIAQAARMAGMTPTAAYTLRKQDADMAAAFDEALEIYIDTAEMELRRRAIDGVDEPVIHQGQLCYITDFEVDDRGIPILDADGEPIINGRRPLTVNRKSDPLLKFLLEGNRKRVYASRTELTGPDGQPLDLHDDHALSARVAQLMQVANQRKEEHEAEQSLLDGLA